MTARMKGGWTLLTHALRHARTHSFTHSLTLGVYIHTINCAWSEQDGASVRCIYTMNFAWSEWFILKEKHWMRCTCLTPVKSTLSGCKKREIGCDPAHLSALYASHNSFSLYLTLTLYVNGCSGYNAHCSQVICFVQASLCFFWYFCLASIFFLFYAKTRSSSMGILNPVWCAGEVKEDCQC